jgi:hypothetical protein
MDDSTSLHYSEELTRAVDMLRSMPIPKLSRSTGEVGPTRAERARDVAQFLADLAADAESGPRRVIPDVGDPAVGDQIAVTGRDLVRSECGEQVMQSAAESLRALRLAI